MRAIIIYALAAPALLTAAQLPVVETAGFPKEVQSAALTATVRVWNAAQGKQGSGVLVGKTGAFVYILTAQHVVEGAERVEVSVFSTKSYPQAQAVYRSAEVVVQAKGLTDLAVLRLTTRDEVPAVLRICPEGQTPAAAQIAVLSAGCEGGKAPTILEEKAGKKRARRPPGNELGTFWEVDRVYASGRSGGPLVDARGRVVGICSGTNRDKTYFAHIDEIHAFLKKNGLRWLCADKER